jgi:hypothetical protein
MSYQRARLTFLVASAATIGFFTLGPVGPSHAWFQGSCCELTDVVLNVLLFLPLGMSLGVIGTRPLLATGIGALASAAIEITQLWIPGRQSSIHDVVTNTLGTLLGAVIVAGWADRKRWWRIAGPAFAAMILLACLAGGFLVRPAAPRPGGWWGQWAHEFGGTVQFGGRVLGFTLQGMAIPDGRLAEGSRLNALLADTDTIRLSASVVSGTPVADRAQLVGIVADGPGGEYLGLWQEGRALLAFVRLRLTDASLRTAWLRLEPALPETSGDTVVLTAISTARRVSLSSDYAGSHAEGSFNLSAAFFWASLLPFELETPTHLSVWPLVPMTLAFVGLGLGVRNGVALLVAAAVALFAGPLMAGTAFPPWTAVATALAGSAFGRWLALRLGLES